MISRYILVGLLLLIEPSAVGAGDGSAANVIGFSADGRYFAFEQYGERDGNGEVFSEIYTIDVRDDRYEEAPVRESWTPDNGAANPRAGALTLDQVRRKAASRAAPSLKRLALDTAAATVGADPEARPADILGQIHIPPLRDGARDTLALTFPTGAARLTLRTLDFDLKRCEHLVPDGRPKGVAIVLERQSRPPLTLTQDRSIPASRGCPHRYGFAAAYALARPDGSTALAVLMQYFYSAFEGPDRRFFVVTAAVR